MSVCAGKAPLSGVAAAQGTVPVWGSGEFQGTGRQEGSCSLSCEGKQTASFTLNLSPRRPGWRPSHVTWGHAGECLRHQMRLMRWLSAARQGVRAHRRGGHGRPCWPGCNLSVCMSVCAVSGSVYRGGGAGETSVGDTVRHACLHVSPLWRGEEHTLV